MIGHSQPNPYWAGEIRLLANCPSAGIDNQYIGHLNITEQPIGVMNTLSFDLPHEVQAALQNVHDDFRFTIIVNTSQNSGPYFLDNLRFAKPWVT